ncbi:MAG: OmpH family outer membrane protein [Phycisphaerae bacterium]|nr:OmpH family outer membrane protein [Phycisphaerae bacterium]
MKTTVVALSCLTAVVVSFAAGLAGGGKAAVPTLGVPSIGVVNLMEILRKDRKYADEMVSDRSKAQTELAALAREIQTDEGELGTLKPASADYLKQMETVAEKKAHYSAHKEYLERQMLLKRDLRSQKMYSEIVWITHEVAVQKGLSLVLVKEDPNTPQLEEMSTRIVTQKVLYCDGCPDITQEVQARLSTAKP